MIAFPQYKDSFHDQNDEEEEDEEEDNVVILGKGSPENLKFEWTATEWSKCSHNCGGNGFQIRTIHCLVKLHNTSQNVDKNLCEDAGLPTPVAVRKCGDEECPKWVTSDWTPCVSSKCFTWNMGGYLLKFRLIMYC